MIQPIEIACDDCGTVTDDIYGGAPGTPDETTLRCVDCYLKYNGFDPVELGQQIADFVKQLLAERFAEVKGEYRA